MNDQKSLEQFFEDFEAQFPEVNPMFVVLLSAGAAVAEPSPAVAFASSFFGSAFACAFTGTVSETNKLIKITLMHFISLFV